MPKINDVKSKPSSTKKPLKDVTGRAFRPPNNKSTNKKSKLDNREQGPGAIVAGGGSGDPLDRLLLVHSDLSTLIHQIDELVVQALNQKVANKKEIESFANVLSEMQSSLKPWIPRFQKVLSSHCIESDNHLQVSLASKNASPSINEDKSKALDSADIYEIDSLVSPSPLVSWRADCTAEGGRQLFLLTPLPRPKAFSSRLKESSKSVFEKVRPNNLSVGEETKPPADVLSEPVATNLKSVVESGFISPEKLTKKNASLVISTPCLKMSPPKSCMFLEPISDYSCKNNIHAQKSTPFPVGVGGCGDSDSSSSQPSAPLALKYPELFGIRPARKLENTRKVVEESPNWRMSPPKTCILLEPTDYDKALSTTVIEDAETKFAKDSIQSLMSSNKVLERTPMFKDLDTTILRGKHPGENTLKKELWMRFEAATTHGSRFKASDPEETAGVSDKGFMDLLEEVSCNESSSIL